MTQIDSKTVTFGGGRWWTLPVAFLVIGSLLGASILLLGGVIWVGPRLSWQAIVACMAVSVFLAIGGKRSMDTVRREVYRITRSGSLLHLYNAFGQEIAVVSTDDSLRLRLVREDVAGSGRVSVPSASIELTVGEKVFHTDSAPPKVMEAAITALESLSGMKRDPIGTSDSRKRHA